MRKPFLAVGAAFTIASALIVPAAATTATAKTTVCHARAGGRLPDRHCTPGVTDALVTQSNIGATICLSGYSKSVRPSATYTNKLKRQQIAEYRYADKNPRHYEEDHLISLELGGDPRDPRNLWPERGASPNPKDRIENQLHREVCAYQITLADAQHLIQTDWRQG